MISLNIYGMMSSCNLKFEKAGLLLGAGFGLRSIALMRSVCNYTLSNCSYGAGLKSYSFFELILAKTTYEVVYLSV